MAKIRLDQLVLDRGMADSRTRAQALIMSGKVMRGTERLTKPGMALDAASDIVLEGQEHPWVSRGGMKLAHGLEAFAVNPAGFVCVDVGASTGGFTDVLLHHGAAKVYAVDVGHGQLDIKLRNDPRVVVMEKTNARHLTQEQIPDPVNLIVCDASFISLKTVLPAVMRLAEESGTCMEQEAQSGDCASLEHGKAVAYCGAQNLQERSAIAGATGEKRGAGASKKLLIALIKPQFEAGKAKLRKGVVRDPQVHAEVCAEIQRWLGEDMVWHVLGISESPVKGPKGNIEFLIFAEKLAPSSGV